jgi:hypothetical protein
MMGGVILVARDGPGLGEFLSDPSLTVACVLLIVVSVGWVVVTRLILHDLNSAAYRRRGTKPREAKPVRDIWSSPP